ncbi:hypothetical protein GIB67_002675 [Kingdonia uniflora]|uniref:beta-galactosidase n=1 Tax=Kingdonia uniflora TaxID=39325 RepID=A0A7J7LJG0_9MAGN|nr:hypothetical protein GIB67_002675 [Kingdonia uniflora]
MSMNIYAPKWSYNTDEIQIGKSSGIAIMRLFIGTGDDCVLLCPDKENILVYDVMCSLGHGISVCSLRRYDNEELLEGIHMSNYTLTGIDNGVRIKIGFLVWLKYVPGISFRIDNEPFKATMKGFTTKIVNMMKVEGLFETQRGPIMMSQIENEYGPLENLYGNSGREYTLITFGGTVHRRPEEDLAFSVTRFIQNGGSFNNYYIVNLEYRTLFNITTNSKIELDCNKLYLKSVVLSYGPIHLYRNQLKTKLDRDMYLKSIVGLVDHSEEQGSSLCEILPTSNQHYSFAESAEEPNKLIGNKPKPWKTSRTESPLKGLFLSNSSFLRHAEYLFDLNINQPILSQPTSIEDHNTLDTKLIMNCANELMAKRCTGITMGPSNPKNPHSKPEKQHIHQQVGERSL